MKRDNEVALATTPWLLDHQGVRNRAGLLAEFPSEGSLETLFLKEDGDLASVTALFKAPSSSQLSASFLRLLSMYFYTFLLQRVREQLCMLV